MTRLMGHVLAQKYPSPDRLSLPFQRTPRLDGRVRRPPPKPAVFIASPCAAWPKGASRPNAPIIVKAAVARPTARGSSPPPRAPTKRLTRKERRRVRQIQAEIRSRVRRGWPTGAKEILAQGESQRLLSAAIQLDEARRDIARGYFRAGKDLEALKSADRAADNTGAVALAHWWGGLAAWRLGRMEERPTPFRRPRLVGKRRRLEHGRWRLLGRPCLASGAGTEPGEPIPRDRRPVPRSPFYGLLSRRALGLDIDYDWDTAWRFAQCRVVDCRDPLRQPRARSVAGRPRPVTRNSSS